ncbi:ski-like protein [Phycodurus eques]|uniref:ski-like protein n=1 Tax=Phycodurus eques TaxID=693459 RepID=UPI002ACE25B7|nr:ski-like protein [Phycodurus eques]
MAGTQTSLKSPFKGLSSFKGSMKRLYRERLEDAPIKKRVMAEINLKRHGLESFHKAAKVKREHAEEAHQQLHHRDMDAELHAAASAKALDLSPGLKHTLAQFTLSSQSSLGGPAAFSARTGHERSHAGMPPLPSPPILGGGPLLVPCDSSTELTHSLLEGESISCFVVGGEKRLCLPQVLNSVLRDFSLQQINTVCDELYVYCSRCDTEQLHILKVLGILPFNAPSCGLITLTDAQRLCNALLRPGAAAPAELGVELSGPLKENEASFQVEHQCLGKCQGLFLPQFYTQPEAPCVQCVECHLLFSPQKFVMHSHKSPDKRTCHWGFDSAKWPCYLQLARKYQGSPEEAKRKRLLDEVKDKFHYQLKKSLDKKGPAGDEDQENQACKSSTDLCSPDGKLAEAEPTGKGKTSPTVVYNQLFPDIKEEPGHPTLVHPSYYLYTYDKMVAPNVSLRRQAEMSPEMLSALLKHHYARGPPLHDEPPMDLHASPPLAEEAKSQHAAERECQTQAVSMAMSSLSGKIAARTRSPPPLHPASPAHEEAGCAVNMTVGGLEDDKDRIVVEIMQMYGRQQEKLDSTLLKQLQLEMELEALRGGEAARLHELSAEQRELRTELEAVHSEQARQLGQARHEQLELEARLEQLRQQACACEPASQRQHEAHYVAQLSELRQRLERAEADRQELQDELRREREARENLERAIGQLKQQMARSGAVVPAGGSPSPPLTPSTGPPNAHSPPSSSPSFSEVPK